MINDPFEKVALPTGKNLTDLIYNNDTVETVLRYGDDWITVSNCGDELTYQRNDSDIVERFE